MNESGTIRRALDFQGNGEVEITIATNAGACFGVVRAIKLGFQAAERGAAQGAAVYSLGALVHNPQVVKELEATGVKTVSKAETVESGTVILRSHGIQAEVEADLRAKGVGIVDATCPLVKKPQRIAQSLGEKGYFLIVVGDANHPEIKGVLSYFNRPDYLVTYNPAAVMDIPASVTRVGVLAQTTIEAGMFDAVAEAARKRFPDTVVYNTICDATSIRQTEAHRLAQGADVVIVVGGKNSSNTGKLVKICRSLQEATYHVEHYEEIEPRWLEGKRRIAVTAGAATPHEFVDATGEYIARLLRPQSI